MHVSGLEVWVAILRIRHTTPRNFREICTLGEPLFANLLESL